MTVQYSDFEKILRKDSDDDWISWVGSDQYDNDQKITYSFETSLPSYWSSPPHGSENEVETYQQDTVDRILSHLYTPWSVSFADVAEITFEETTGTSAGDIVVMEAPDMSVLGDATLPGEDSWDNVAGDVFFSQNHRDGSGVLSSSNTVPWKEGYNVIMHELGHSLGLSHTNITSNVDNQKYTIQTENPHTGMGEASNLTVWPSGLQLLDIAAIQELYGRNYATRVNNDTYSATSAFDSSEQNDAFIYTIWDGGGTDEIDASGYADWVVVDLRQGEYSSVGRTLDYGQSSPYNGVRGLGLADENLAISYFSVIENAKGTNDSGSTGGIKHGDILIGNAWNNTLVGLDGDDYLYGDGVVYTGATGGYAGFLGVDLDDQDDADQDGDPANDYVDDQRPWNDDPTDDDYNLKYADDLSGKDHLIGGNGNDHLYGGAGNDILDGGLNNDKLYGGDGDADVADFSSLSESVTITVDSANQNFDFKATSDTNGHIDNIVDVEIFKGTSGIDTLDLSTGAGNKFSVDQNGKTYNLKDINGDSYLFQNFENLLTTTSNDTIELKGFGGIQIVDSSSSDSDTVILQKPSGDVLHDPSFISGVGLYVSASEVKNTYDGSTFENIENFENVTYANITTLGHSFQAADVGYLNQSGYVSQNTYGYIGDMPLTVLDYSGFADELEFDFGTGDVSLKAGGGSSDSFNAGFDTIVGTNNDGDVFDFTGSNGVKNLYTGAGDDELTGAATAYAKLPQVVTNYVYTGGDDTIENVSVQNIYLPHGVDDDDITFSYTGTPVWLQYEDGSNHYYSSGNLVINVAGYGSITVDNYRNNMPSLILENNNSDAVAVSASSTGFSEPIGNDFYHYTSTSYKFHQYDDYPFRLGEYYRNYYYSTAGSDTLPEDTYSFFGLGGNDVISPSFSPTYDNIFDGGAGNDTIYGLDGSDTLIGGVGDDQLYGGNDDDILQGGEGADTLDGGTGNDMAMYGYNHSSVYVDLAQSGANVDEDYDGTTPSYSETLTGIENVTGSAFNDTLKGDANDNELHGLEGDDQLYGGGGGDKFYIGSGFDTVNDFDVTQGDILSIENDTVIDFNSLVIVHTDYATETIAEVYKSHDLTKLADVHLPLSQRLSASNIEFNSYLIESADDTPLGNGDAYVSSTTFEVALDNNFNPMSPRKTIVRNPFASGELEFDGSNPTAFDDDMWSLVSSYWIPGEPVVEKFLLFGNGTYMMLYADYAIMLEYGGNPYIRSVNVGAGQGLSAGDDPVEYDENGNQLDENGNPIDPQNPPAEANGSSASITIYGFTPDGSGNDDTFVFYSTNQSMASPVTDYVYEDVNAGFDQVNIIGASASDAIFSTDSSGDLLIKFVGYPNYTIEIDASFITGHGSDVTERIEQINFIDDGVWDVVDLSKGLVLEGTSVAETLQGTLKHDTLHGYEGADTLNGGDGNDALHGGIGDDTLYGQLGHDSYHWSIGDGDDTISESSGGGIDRLVLGENITPGDVRFLRYSTDELEIFIGSEKIRLQNQLRDLINGTSNDDFVETLHFADGQIIDLVNDLTFTGTSSGETIYGLDDNNILIGREGNDSLNGYDGNDQYIWNIGDGNDTITEQSGVDELVLGDGISLNDIRFMRYSTDELEVFVGTEKIRLKNQLRDLINGTSNDDFVDTLRLADDTTIDLVNNLTLTGTSSGETIYGLDDNNILIGRGGDDSLSGYDGNDEYHWSVGDGNDTIYEEGGVDELVLGAGVTLNDIRFARYGTDELEVFIGSEKIRLQNQLRDLINSTSNDDFVDTLRLADDTTIDLVNNLTLTGTSSGETITGLDDDNTLIGLAGADYLYGKDGNDTLYGGDGDDRLYGDDDNDILYGGDGIDLLWGDDGADTFAFESATAFNFSDNIQDFDLAEGDMLDVSDLLSGYDPMTDAITDFVQITDNGTHSYLAVDADGGADNFVQVAAIFNETGLTDEASLESSGTLITV